MSNPFENVPLCPANDGTAWQQRLSEPQRFCVDEASNAYLSGSYDAAELEGILLRCGLYRDEAENLVNELYFLRYGP